MVEEPVEALTFNAVQIANHVV
eukprot:SAG11_NODE_13271_length_662_cov_0.998224_1_plen_21_part_01